MTPDAKRVVAAEVLPNGWAVRTLDQLASWCSGGTPPKSVRGFWEGPIPWVSPKDMKSFDLRDAIDHLSQAGVDHGSRMAPADAIFVVVRGMILAHTFPVSVAGCPMAFNQDVKGIVANPDVHPRFLAHWFVANAPELLRLATASTHGTKKIDLPDLLRFSVRLPPVPEQRRIAEILDAADEAIRGTEAVIAKLRSTRTGLLNTLIGTGSGAKTVPLLSLCKGGGSYGSPAAAREYDPSLPRYVRITDLTDDGSLSPSSLASIVDAEALPFLLEEGDLLFARSGATVGKTYLYSKGDGRCAHAGYVIKFRIDAAKAAPRFVLFFTQTSAYRAWIQRTLRQGAQPNINAEEYAGLPVPCPPSLVEQSRIAAVVGAADRRLRAEKSYLAKLKLQKQGLMQDFLTGRVRVKV